MSTTEINPDDWLTIKEVADRWKVSYDTILRQTRSEKIPSLRIGGITRIALEVVESMEQQAKQARVKQTVETLKIARRGGFALTSAVDHYPDC